MAAIDAGVVRDAVLHAKGGNTRKPTFRSSKLTQLLWHTFESHCALGMILHVRQVSLQPSLCSAEFLLLLHATCTAVVLSTWLNAQQLMCGITGNVTRIATPATP
jgi:hypothetical protein